MPFYVYEVPSIKHREERNWENDDKAKTAIKHVARRAAQVGAGKDDPVLVSLKTDGRKLYEGTVGEASKGVA